MIALTILFRRLQFYTHMAHNLTSGETFFQDHDFLGSLYGTYEGIYDSLVERTIGLYGDKSIDLLKVHRAAVERLEAFESTEECFGYLLEDEKKICEEIGKLCKNKDVTEGTKNLIQGIADDSEIRQYKFKRRIMKDKDDK